MSMANGDLSNEGTVQGIAALSLLEALILVLLERGTLTDDELDVAFNAAIGAHRSHNGGTRGSNNVAVARLLERLQVHGNSVRLDG